MAIVDTRERRLLRRVRVPGATGVAVTPDGRTLVTARGRLRIIAARRAARAPAAMRLPRGAGGNLALSPGRTRLAVGARRGGRSGALVVLRSSRVRRLSAGGRGVGTPAWTPDANRLFFANRGAGTLSLVSPFSRRLLDTVRCPARRRAASSCSRASRSSAARRATTRSWAPARATASRAWRATTCCAAAASATCSRAGRATTACPAARSATA